MSKIFNGPHPCPHGGTCAMKKPHKHCARCGVPVKCRPVEEKRKEFISNFGYAPSMQEMNGPVVCTPCYEWCLEQVRSGVVQL